MITIIMIINEMQLYLNDQILFFWKILALLALHEKLDLLTFTHKQI